NRESESPDHRIAGARNVEYLLCNGRNMKRRLAALAKKHSQFPQRYQQQGRFEFTQQTFCNFHQVRISERVMVPGLVRKPGKFEGFFSIWSDQRQSAEIQMVDRFWVQAQP